MNDADVAPVGRFTPGTDSHVPAAIGPRVGHPSGVVDRYGFETLQRDELVPR